MFQFGGGAGNPGDIGERQIYIVFLTEPKTVFQKEIITIGSSQRTAVHVRCNRNPAGLRKRFKRAVELLNSFEGLYSQCFAQTVKSRICLQNPTPPIGDAYPVVQLGDDIGNGFSRDLLPRICP